MRTQSHALESETVDLRDALSKMDAKWADSVDAEARSRADLVVLKTELKHANEASTIAVIRQPQTPTTDTVCGCYTLCSITLSSVVTAHHIFILFY